MSFLANSRQNYVKKNLKCSQCTKGLSKLSPIYRLYNKQIGNNIYKNF